MWRATGAHVQGASHLKVDTPCQDYCEYRRALIGSTPVLLVGIADGAGSARLSQLGSRACVEYLLQNVPSTITSVEVANEDTAGSWLSGVRQQLEQVAASEGCDLRDLACTVLFAILADATCIFVQLGDGAWIMDQYGQYSAATWPRGGEYANETTFITSTDWQKDLQFASIPGPVGAVAGFTDGLQRIALEMTSRIVHEPFFKPLFSVLRDTDDETSLISPLIEYLSSPSIRERADDDLTLVLACRSDPLSLPPC